MDCEFRKRKFKLIDNCTPRDSQNGNVLLTIQVVDSTGLVSKTVYLQKRSKIRFSGTNSTFNVGQVENTNTVTVSVA